MSIRSISVGLRLLAFVLLGCLLIPVGYLQAQTVTGTIVGSVLDPSGAAVPSAAITITNQDTGVVRTAVSTSDGLYSVPSLLPGKYSVEGMAQGFSPAQVKDVVVNVGSDARVDLKLAVGSTTQAVTVTESVPTVETTNSEVSQIMDQDLIKDVPLNARDIQQLAVIQPGVQWDLYDYAGKALSVAGDRPSHNRFLQEGIDLTTTYKLSPVSLASNVVLGVEAVKEFKVTSTDFTAEYGEQSGGTINTIFKSGTNDWHGSVYEYYRNAVFDAKNYFDHTSSAPPFHRHQFGASFGGPIKKDNTFFFVNYEGYRSYQSQSFFANVPDSNARGTGGGLGELVPNAAGVLTAVTPTANSAAIYNIFFSGTNPVMPVCQSQSSEVLSSAGFPTGACQWFSNPVQSIQENYGLVKIDHTFGSKNTLSSTYNIDPSTEYEPVQWGGTADFNYFRRQVFSLQDTEIISTNLVNTLRTGVNRVFSNFEADLVGDPTRFNGNGALPGQPGSLFLPGTSSANSPYPQMPTIAVSGISTIGSAVVPAFSYAPRWFGYTAALLTDDINYLHGKHAFQFGAQAKKWDDNLYNWMSAGKGNYSFSSLPQFLQGGPAASFSWTVQGLSNYGRAERSYFVAAYAEDTYKLKPSLTLTYGLRWEYELPTGEAHNLTANIYNPQPEISPALTLGGPGVGGSYYKSSNRDFAPRLGFNWDPFKKGKTSIRGGFGIFFNQIEDDSYFAAIAGQPPYSFAAAVTPTSPVNPGGETLPFNAATLNTAINSTFPGTNIKVLKANFGGGIYAGKTPTKYGYNLTAQQELPDHISLMIAYVGSQGRHFGRSVSLQQYYPTAVETPGKLPQVNGVDIPNSVINPNCTKAGQLTCLYWAGVGLANANLLGNNPATNPTTSQYATTCTNSTAPAGGEPAPCYNNNNFGNSVGIEGYDANVFYNSLQTALERRMSPGFYARFNYTWNRCINDSDDDLPASDNLGGGAGGTVTRNHASSRGRCTYLGTHSANLTLAYDSPFGKMVSSRFAKALVSGWQISSLTGISSGSPFSVTEGANVARYASTTPTAGVDRPDWAAPSTACPNPTATGVITKDPLHYFNVNCFQAAAPGYLGDVGASIFTSPTTFNTDISLKRNIALKREGMSVELGADMFNAFNRVNLLGPGGQTAAFTTRASVTTPGQYQANGTAGQISGTATSSRQLQINARFVF